MSWFICPTEKYFFNRVSVVLLKIIFSFNPYFSNAKTEYICRLG